MIIKVKQLSNLTCVVPNYNTMILCIVLYTSISLFHNLRFMLEHTHVYYYSYPSPPPPPHTHTHTSLWYDRPTFPQADTVATSSEERLVVFACVY